MRLIILGCLAAFLGGCAGERDLRGASAQSAAILVQYRQGMTEFANRQTDLNRGIELGLSQTDAATRRARDEVDARLLGWQIEGDNKSIARLKALSAVGAADILAEGSLLNPRKPVPATAALKFDGDAVDGVVKKLTALAKGPSAEQRVGDLLDFTGKLRKAYGEAIDEAAQASSDAKPKAAGNP